MLVNTLGPIKELIEKDIEKTNVDIELFQRENIKKILTDILLVWIGKNSDAEYVHGMIEIASLIFLVLHEESLSNTSSSNEEILSSYSIMIIIEMRNLYASLMILHFLKQIHIQFFLGL